MPVEELLERTARLRAAGSHSSPGFGGPRVLSGSGSVGTPKRFFEQMRPEIEPVMAAAGLTGEPEMTFWRKLEIRRPRRLGP